MAKKTVYNSFKQALPKFRQVGSQVETRAKSSGTTTEACTPPRCGINIPVKHWTDLASRLCLDQHKKDLKSMHLSPADNSVAFKSEADVVEASASYLRQPVQFAYQLVHPKDICLKQLTKPQKDMTAASRVDVAYFSGLPNNENTPGNSTNVFAVMEYKKFNGLSRKQFRKKTVSNSREYASVVEFTPFVMPETNAEIALKQATHYASKYDTPFVALCDYNTLILLVMDQVEGLQGGQYTYLTVVAKSADMRKAYLGFLLAARLHAQGKDDWRTNGAGEDIFVEAEEWEQEFQSGDAKEKPERNTIIPTRYTILRTARGATSPTQRPRMTEHPILSLPEIRDGHLEAASTTARNPKPGNKLHRNEPESYRELNLQQMLGHHQPSPLGHRPQNQGLKQREEAP